VSGSLPRVSVANIGQNVATFAILNRLWRMFSATARLLASSSAKTKTTMVCLCYLCVCVLVLWCSLVKVAYVRDRCSTPPQGRY
jgi:hypothetical protein